jgi:hypothetical protein
MAESRCRGVDRIGTDKIRVERDPATGAYFHYRDRDYLGFTAPIQSEGEGQHAAVRFDRSRGTHVHLGFFDTDDQASTALRAAA